MDGFVVFGFLGRWIISVTIDGKALAKHGLFYAQYLGGREATAGDCCTIWKNLAFKAMILDAM